MKSLLCRLFSLAALGMLAAAPAVADSSATFRLDQPVQVGGAMLPAGVYVFRASDRGVVSVFDLEMTRYAAVTLANRQPANARGPAELATLTHDWAVRTLTFGDRTYRLSPGKAPETLAARPTATATVLALAR